MNECQAIVAAAIDADKAGDEALLATVVCVRGSAYRRPGARMLITRHGWMAGSISGGCLESDVSRKAWWHTRGGAPVVLTYDSTIDDAEDDLSWGFGLGCSGVVEVLLERLTPEAITCPAAFIARCLERNRPGILATVIRAEQGADNGHRVRVGQRLLLEDGDEAAISTIADRRLAAQVEADSRAVLDNCAGTQSREYTLDESAGARVDVLLELVAPPTPLVIFGAGHDAVPLAHMAKALGWQVTVVEPRAGTPPRPDRFPGADRVVSCPPRDVPARVRLDASTMAVVMTHNVALDAALLQMLTENPVRYVGMLGPRRRAERLLASVGGADLGERLYSPIGLDIGADAPETIALSILSEMQAVLFGRGGGFLRQRNRPIHDLFATQTAPNSPPNTPTPAVTTCASAA